MCSFIIFFIFFLSKWPLYVNVETLWCRYKRSYKKDLFLLPGGFAELVFWTESIDCILS